MAWTAFRGTFVHCPQLGQVEILEDYLLGVDESGFITHFSPAKSESSTLVLERAISPIEIPLGSLMLPTFCDLHLHAPQFLYQGVGFHLPLMQWLDEYAYKAEEHLDGNRPLARNVYTRLAQRLLENGTGAVLMFGTIKEETNLVLAEVMQQAGIRAHIGKLSMDISSRPNYLEPSAEQALSAAASFIDACRNITSTLPKHRRLVQPVITPRFVPTCSDALLRGLGDIANNQSVRIQSHLAEAHDQVDWVKRERGIEDLEIFERSHLLTPRTIQAHCTFLDPSSLSYLSLRGTAVAHCPLSNAYFSAQPFRLREALQLGVKVGLGTDVAGGYSLDMMVAMRQAVAVSKMRQGARIIASDAAAQKGGESEPAPPVNLSINWKESLYLATRGGALALDLPPGSGIFEVGAPFDAQKIQMYDLHKIGTGALDYFDLGNSSTNQTISIEMIEKWWCIGDIRNRQEMWIQGIKVF